VSTMNRADRLAGIVSFGLGAIAWIGLAIVMLALDPRGDAVALVAGAVLLGAAIGLTVAPLLWLITFNRARGIAYRGDWWRASRRAALVGFVAAVLVILRGQGAFSLPLAAFIVVLAVLAELAMSLRR